MKHTTESTEEQAPTQPPRRTSKSLRGAPPVREENDDENSAAFLMHSMGMLTMVRDASQRFTKVATAAQVTAIGGLHQRMDDLLAKMKECVAAASAAAAGQGASLQAAQAPRRWVSSYHTEMLHSVLQTVDNGLLPIALAAGTGAEAVKMRKLARDLLHLIVVRSVSMLSHRLPLLIDLSVCHGVFAWHRHTLGRGKESEATPHDVEVEEELVVTNCTQNDSALSDSVHIIVAEEENRLWNAHRGALNPACADPPHNAQPMFPVAHPLLDALVSGVLGAERCLLRSLELLSQCSQASSSASSDDAASVRTTIKTCVDVNRSLKELLGGVYTRLDKAMSSYVGDDGSLSPVVTVSRCAQLASVPITEGTANTIASFVAGAIGVDVCRMLSTFGFEVTRVSCGHLVQVASIAGTQETLSAAVYKNKMDATMAMFRIMDALVVDLSNAHTCSSLPSNSGVEEGTLQKRSVIQLALRRRFLPTTLFSDFIASIARHCGDENDGQLLCVRLLTDGFQYLCGVAPALPTNGNDSRKPAATTTVPAAAVPATPQDESSVGRSSLASSVSDENLSSVLASSQPVDLSGASNELEQFMRSPLHRRASFSGLLNVLVSVHRPVLDAALKCLENLVSQECCLAHCSQDIGFVYANALIRQLESDQSPAEMKLQLVQHYRSLLRRTVTLHSGTREETAQGEGGEHHSLDATAPSTPLILILYRVFDVNRRLHQVHLVQQYVAALARIVRSAAPSEFVLVHGSNGAETLAQAALTALVVTAELLAESLPPQAISDLNSLRDIALLRSEKVDDQRALDVINNVPVKGICKRFFIDKATLEQRELPTLQSPEEEGSSPTTIKPVAEPSLEYSQVPEPPNDEIAGKALAIADFLLHTPAINPVSVGEFLSDAKIFPLQVCRRFMSALDLHGRSITGALGEMLSVLQLPKEGQRIERLLEFFTHAYFIANTSNNDTVSAREHSEDSGSTPRFEDRMLFPPASQHFPFANPDACFIVVVATVMLNTDLHNPRVSSKMTRDMFRSQLRGCNDGKDFPEGFAEGIFDSISKQPLSNVKGIGATSVSGGSHVSTALAPAGAMDMIFFSASERKELMFGMERQRLVMETRELLSRRSCPELDTLLEFTAASHEGHRMMLAALARDMFACMWPSLCVVFGVAASPLVTGVLPTNARLATPPSPDSTLLRVSLRGLRAAFTVATAFQAHKESDTILSTILKIAESSSHKHVIDGCLRLLLETAASEHAVYLSPYAWGCLVKTLVDIRKNPGSTLATDAESVFGHLEVLVARASDANFARRNIASDAMRLAVSSISSSAASSPGDGLSLGAHLYVLRRMLIFTSVVTRQQPSEGHSPRVAVEKRIAMPLFLAAFGRRAWYTLMQAHGGSNECLQLLYECYAELVSEVWSTVGPTLHIESPSLSSDSSEAQPDDGTPATGVRQQSQAQRSKEDLFLQCFEVVVEGMRGSGGTVHRASSTMHTYILQGVKTILSTTVAATASADASSRLVPLPIAIRVWLTLMRPLVVAITDADIVASEACAIAVLALRHLVVCWCGSRRSGGPGSTVVVTEGAVSNLLPSKYRVGLGILLAHVAYAGSVCADLTSAHSCIAQFSTLMTTALSHTHGLMGRSSSAMMTPPDQLLADASTFSDDAHHVPRLHDRVVHTLLDAIHRAHEADGGGESAMMSSCVMERLSLILRSDKQSVRQEAIDVMRNLALLVANDGDAVAHMLHHTGYAVLEASLGYANPNHKTSTTEPCLITFPLFDMDVPSTLKRCTRTSFSATLPAILHAVATDILPMLPANLSARFSIFWAERCLLPLVLSPRVQSHSLRILALRALVQIVQWVLERAEVVGSAVVISHHAAERVVDIMMFLLHCASLCTHEPTSLDIMQSALSDARPMLTVHARDLDTYVEHSNDALKRLQYCDPSSLCSIREFCSMRRDFLHHSMPAAATPAAPTTSTAGALTPTPLLDDATFLQQVWSLLPMIAAPLPKLFNSLRSRMLCNATAVNMPQENLSEQLSDVDASSSPWVLPRVANTSIVLSLLAHCANHALALHSIFIQALLSGNAASLTQPPLSTVLSLISASGSSSANEHTMHPHAAIRGLLTTLIQTELHMLEHACAPVANNSETAEVSSTLESHLVDVFRITERVLDGATRVLQGSTPGSTVHATGGSSAAMNPHILHLGRSCCSGMAQELSVVINNVVTMLSSSFASSCSPDSAHGQSHLALLERCLATEDLFDAITSLLSPVPLAAPLITPVKKYLVIMRTIGGQSRGPLCALAKPQHPLAPSIQDHTHDASVAADNSLEDARSAARDGDAEYESDANAN